MDFDRQRHRWSEGFLAAVRQGEFDGSAAQSERERVRMLVRDHVDAGAGFLVMTGLEVTEQDICEQVLLWASEALGTVMDQDKAGTRIRSVRNRGTVVGEGRSARYADSRHGGHLHTDGAERPFPLPDYFTLLCVRPAKAGGMLRLVPVDRLRALLADRPDALAVLEQDFHFDRRGDQASGESATVRKPVLFRTADDRHAVTYLRQYIEIGHGQPGADPLTPTQRGALDAFDAVLEDPASAVEGRMAAGELAVFNNLRILHGRTTFDDHPDPGRARLLYRTWIRRTPAVHHTAGR
ncbi:TauD/TfdA family dioxygenase [Streptomyces sp. NBC_00878]|uniref:TauD/TfdA family dioxygenase n=1 Tax=Streptomyces sp. NBC_00878 TaxID=2975854 RepID=UPI0022597625|nr:TauD/TfdA family dioxygenase [Streptomyces sp. NBC_00878]MCX4902788.1 TauD/TfdA family dioxygenase [Streptomyces sp. NBC_00878]